MAEMTLSQPILVEAVNQQQQQLLPSFVLRALDFCHRAWAEFSERGYPTWIRGGVLYCFCALAALSRQDYTLMIDRGALFGLFGIWCFFPGLWARLTNTSRSVTQDIDLFWIIFAVWFIVNVLLKTLFASSEQEAEKAKKKRILRLIRAATNDLMRSLMSRLPGNSSEEEDDAEDGEDEDEDNDREEEVSESDSSTDDDTSDSSTDDDTSYSLRDFFGPPENDDDEEEDDAGNDDDNESRDMTGTDERGVRRNRRRVSIPRSVHARSIMMNPGQFVGFLNSIGQSHPHGSSQSRARGRVGVSRAIHHQLASLLSSEGGTARLQRQNQPLSSHVDGDALVADAIQAHNYRSQLLSQAMRLQRLVTTDTTMSLTLPHPSPPQSPTHSAAEESIPPLDTVASVTPASSSAAAAAAAATPLPRVGTCCVVCQELPPVAGCQTCKHIHLCAKCLPRCFERLPSMAIKCTLCRAVGKPFLVEPPQAGNGPAVNADETIAFPLAVVNSPVVDTQVPVPQDTSILESLD